MAQTGERLFPVSNGKKLAYVNSRNEIRIPFRYSSAELFKNGLAIVKKGKLCGAIDSAGNERIPFRKGQLYCKDDHWLFRRDDSLIQLYDLNARCFYTGPANDDYQYSSVLGLFIINSFNKNKHCYQAELFKMDGKSIYRFRDPHPLYLSFLLDPELHDTLMAMSRVFIKLLQSDAQPLLLSLINSEAQVIIDSLQELKRHGEEVFLRKDGYVALMKSDLSFEIPFDAAYTELKKMDRCRYYLCKNASGYGILDEEYKEVLPCIYEKAPQYLYEDYFRIKNSSSTYLYLKSGGDTVLECSDYFDSTEIIAALPVKFQVDRLAAALRMISYDYEYRLWKKGNFVGPFYKYIYQRSENPLVFESNGNAGWLDTNGNKLFTAQYRFISPSINKNSVAVKSFHVCDYERAKLNEHTEFMLLNENGSVAGDACFDRIFPFNGDYGIAIRDSSYFILNKNGNVKALHHKPVSGFSNGCVLVKKEKQYALADTNGSLLSGYFDQIDSSYLQNFTYELLENAQEIKVHRDSYQMPLFKDSLLMVYRSSRWGLIKSNGTYALYPLYNSIIPIYKGNHLAYYKLIYKRGRTQSEGLCDSYGRILLYPTYTSIQYKAEADYFICSSSTNNVESVFVPELNTAGTEIAESESSQKAAK